MRVAFIKSISANSSGFLEDIRGGKGFIFAFECPLFLPLGPYFLWVAVIAGILGHPSGFFEGNRAPAKRRSFSPAKINSATSYPSRTISRRWVPENMIWGESEENNGRIKVVLRVVPPPRSPPSRWVCENSKRGGAHSRARDFSCLSRVARARGLNQISSVLRTIMLPTS